MSVDTNDYQHIIKHTAGCAHISKPKKEDLLEQLGLRETLNPLAPLYFIIDYTEFKYLYIAPSCGNIIGYDCKFLSEAGPAFLTTLWHPADFRIFNEKIFPQVMSFLKPHPVSDYQNFRFTFNYRVKTNYGSFISFLQSSTFISATDDGFPLVEVSFLMDITNYKEDSRIIYKIEKANHNYRAATGVPLFTSVYYPDKASALLSKRELEILRSIYQGMSSKQIAGRYSLSINTVSNHRKNMLQKTKTNNSPDLLRYAFKHGLL